MYTYTSRYTDDNCYDDFVTVTLRSGRCLVRSGSKCSSEVVAKTGNASLGYYILKLGGCPLYVSLFVSVIVHRPTTTSSSACATTGFFSAYGVRSHGHALWYHCAVVQSCGRTGWSSGHLVLYGRVRWSCHAICFSVRLHVRTKAGVTNGQYFSTYICDTNIHPCGDERR